MIPVNTNILIRKVALVIQCIGTNQHFPLLEIEPICYNIQLISVFFLKKTKDMPLNLRNGEQILRMAVWRVHSHHEQDTVHMV